MPACRKFRIKHPSNLHGRDEIGCRVIASAIPRLRPHRVFEYLSIHFPEGAVVNLRFRKERAEGKDQSTGGDCYSLAGIGIGLEFVGLGVEAIRVIEKELSRFSQPPLR
jgi:hypothetical protein